MEKQKVVVIDRSTEWNDDSAPFEVKKITVKDLDEVKKLIGNNDKLFENGTLKPSQHTKEALGLNQVTTETVRQAASAYVFGHSAPVKHLKDQIENIIGSVTIQQATVDEIIIKEPLTIQPGDIKSLQANKITFVDKGQITNMGVLSLSAQLLVNAKTTKI